MGVLVTARCFRWDENSKFMAFLLLLRQALWTLKHMGIHSVFALSTSKELGKRQIQDWMSAYSSSSALCKDGMKLLYEHLSVLR
jgi:hypothetical protein